MTDTNRSRPADGIDSPALDRLFEAVSRGDRRRVLTALVDGSSGDGSGMALEEVTPENPDDELRAALYHNHLPHLDSAGFVDWSRETDTISRGPRYDEIEPLVELLAANGDALPDEWP